MEFYDYNLWNKYTDDEVNDLNPELFELIYHMCVGLGIEKVCEAGCNIGNNLSKFPNDFDVTGFDYNEYPIKLAKERHPNFKFQVEDITKTSFPENTFDLVFTRGVFIHLPEQDVKTAMNELVRISKKWIFNLEYFGNDGEAVKWKRGENMCWYRNMKEKWDDFDVEVITDIEIPTTIDKTKTRLTLVKINSSDTLN